MTQAAASPRWVLQLWSTSPVTNTGEETASQSKQQSECLLRFPLDGPTRLGSRWHESIHWITQVLESEQSQLPLFALQRGYQDVSRLMPDGQRAAAVQMGYQRPTLTRDALVKLVRASDRVVLKEWTIPCDHVYDNSKSEYPILLPAGEEKQLWLIGKNNSINRTSTKLGVCGLIVGQSLLEEEPLCSVFRTLREEHRIHKLAQAVDVVEFKCAALKRARQELDDAERVEQRWRPKPLMQ